jgi:hypothetical protein
MPYIDQSQGFTNKVNLWGVSGIIVLSYLFITFMSNQYIFGEEVYVRSFSDKLSAQSIEAFLGVREKYSLWGYVTIPIVIAIKVSFSAICISIGAVLSNISFKFKAIFRMVLLAEVVFIVAQLLYLVNVSFHLDTLTLETAANYYPLTMLSYFGAENVVDWLQYPLQTLNLFEVAYTAVIGWLLSKQWKEGFAESMLVVLPSYATGLILWLVFVTFITLQVS